MAEKKLFPEGRPVGFPGCAQCPYLKSGSAQACFVCTDFYTQHPGGERCAICDQQLPMALISSETVRCRNNLCNWPEEQRSIERIRAVALYRPPIDRQIRRYKYDGRLGWRLIFGRVFLGFLNHGMGKRPNTDLILPVPTFVGEGSHSKFAHTELVVDVAASEDLLDVWNFDTGNPRILVQTGVKPKSANKSWEEKLDAAESLYSLLKLTNPAAIKDKRILLYDDVCTTGLSLDVIARFLPENGAANVEAVVLTRVPWL